MTRCDGSTVERNWQVFARYFGSYIDVGPYYGRTMELLQVSTGNVASYETKELPI
jgi:hypothetical protein